MDFFHVAIKQELKVSYLLMKIKKLAERAGLRLIKL